MFRNLTDMSYERNFMQAIGFYLAYFLLALLASMVLGGLGDLLFSVGYDGGVKIGATIGIIYTFLLSLTIARAKGIGKSFKVILLVVTAPFLAVFIGALGGMLPVAYLSTLKRSEPKSLTD